MYKLTSMKIDNLKIVQLLMGYIENSAPIVELFSSQ